MSLYAGIDLHANNSVLSIIDSEDRVHFSKRLPNDLQRILAALTPYRDTLEVCIVESTYNWYWLVDGLQAEGYQVKLANTHALQQYSGIKHTNDYTDSVYLAHLARLNLIREGYIYPPNERHERDLLRRRMFFVQQRTKCHIALQSFIARYTGNRLSANEIKQLKDGELEHYFDGSALLNAQLMLLAYEWLDKAVTMIETRVLAQLVPLKHHRILCSAPGIGKLLAATIVLETGPISRFPGAGHYASYARCVSSRKVSNNKSKGQGNRKNGNRYLGWAFMDAAHHAAIWYPKIKRFYQRKASRKHVLVAHKAVANKLARACYYMLREQEVFRMEKAFP